MRGEQLVTRSLEPGALLLHCTGSRLLLRTVLAFQPGYPGLRRRLVGREFGDALLRPLLNLAAGAQCCCMGSHFCAGLLALAFTSLQLRSRCAFVLAPPVL